MNNRGTKLLIALSTTAVALGITATALSGISLASKHETPYIGENGNWWIGSSDLGVAAQGSQGEKGDKGDTGSTGERGPQGSQGEKGDTGSSGPRGPQGETGQTGPAGHDGASILSGSSDPENSVGNNGDTYINTSTGDVFKKNNGSWSKTGNIKGDKGDEIVSVTKTDSNETGDIYTITFTDGSTINFTIEKDAECDHQWSEIYTLQEKTCTQDGKYLYACGACGLLKVIVSATSGHEYFTDADDEITHSSHCRYCDSTKDAENHSFDESMICGVCGYDKNDAMFNFILNSEGTEYTLGAPKGDIPEELVVPTMYKGKPVTAIGIRAFLENASLKKVTITSNIKNICDQSFRGCSNLESVVMEEGVTTIGVGAFCECPALKTISMPSTLGSIGTIAFAECPSITSITVDENNSNYKSIDGSLYDGEGKTLIMYPSGKTDYTLNIRAGTESIGDSAIASAKNIVQVSFPSSLTSIGRSAFFGCSNLKYINFTSNITSIGDYAFHMCSSIAAVVVPNSVTSIGDGTFKQCTSLKSITLPSTIDTIGESMFEGCTSLESFSMPNSVKIVDYAAFKGCTSLKTLTLSDGLEEIGYWAFYGCTSIEEIELPDGFKTLRAESFYGCSHLLSFIMPQAMTEIYYSAFNGCGSFDLYYVGTSSELENVTIGDYPINTLTVFCNDYDVVISGTGISE